MILNDYIKEQILIKLDDIINIKDEKWEHLDTNIKIKILHHFCNFIGTDKNNINMKKINSINIPLKSLKPKKIIEFTSINKNNNAVLFSDFNKLILDYTFDFRKKYILVDKRIYYTFNNLPKLDYYSLLSNYNNIVCNFIESNKKSINVKKFYENLIGNNSKKIIISNNILKDFTLKKYNESFEIIFDNGIIIKFELFYYSDKITKNIPVKYNIKIINTF
jgi:hypothetical protein